MTGGWLSVVRGGIAALGSCAAVGAARAETILGAPVSGQMGFLPANTVVQADIEWFHNDILLPVTIGISLLVLVLLAYVVYRFNEQANPVASRTAHNGPLEIAWTVVPALVLVVIAVPSFRLLSQQLIIPAPDMTLKVTASQWHWNYAIRNPTAASRSIPSLKRTRISSPATSVFCRSTTQLMSLSERSLRSRWFSQDVIHSFSVPHSASIDAVPGRLNKTWFKADHEGVFYGQCSNICGSTTPSCPSRSMS